MKMAESREAGSGHAGAAPALPAVPAHPETVAAEITKKIGTLVSLKPDEEERLATQIRSIVLERMGHFDDMRVGRVLGYAIAAI